MYKIGFGLLLLSMLVLSGCDNDGGPWWYNGLPSTPPVKGHHGKGSGNGGGLPVPTPTPVPTPNPSPTPDPSPTPTPNPDPSPTPTPGPTTSYGCLLSDYAANGNCGDNTQDPLVEFYCVTDTESDGVVICHEPYDLEDVVSSLCIGAPASVNGHATHPGRGTDGANSDFFGPCQE